MNYDPNAPGKMGTLFGLPFSEDESDVVIYPVPWDVTASYHAGSSKGPQAILDASPQLDLEIFGKEPAWKRGIFMKPIERSIFDECMLLREKTESFRKFFERGSSEEEYDDLIEEVNKSSKNLTKRIFENTLELLEKKKVGLVGGDHSVPLGYIQALSQKHDSFGILQFDAHMDLRESYEGFDQSHASIMFNALKVNAVSKLVQVGIRDFCEEELRLSTESDRIKTFFQEYLRDSLFTGKSWDELCHEIVDTLPQKVYISFDIDGLDPSLCPGTGTPVPGGLSFDQAAYLLDQVANSGREIIGFDLCEVAPMDGDKEWNANVGARMLYRLISLL